MKFFARRIVAMLAAAVAVSSCGGRSSSSVPTVHDYRSTGPGTIRITPQSACYWSPGTGWTCGGGGGSTAGPCDISSTTVASEPGNTSRTEIGVSEQVNLTTTGSGWSKSGDGDLSGTSGSSTTLTAGNQAGTVTVSVGARGRICTANSITFTVDPPQRVVYQRYTGVQHVQGEAELAMRSHVYFLPSNVSFYNTSWQEEQAYFSAYGAWQCQNGLPHTGDTSIPMSTTVDPLNGTLGSGYDDEGSGYCPADVQFQPSSESVTIPTDYFSNYDGVPFEIGTFTPVATEDSVGNLNLTKGDASADTTVFSADSGY